MALSTGAYEIVNAANTSLAVDVSDARDANGTNVQLFTRNQAAPQLAWVVVRSDGWATIHFPLIGKVLDNTGNSAAAGTNVEVWDDTGADAGLWKVEEVSGRTVTVDGKSYTAYRIRPKASGALCLDPAGTGAPQARTNLQTYTDLTDYTSADALGQLWAFVPIPGVVRAGTYQLVSMTTIRLSNPGEGFAQGTALHMALDVADGMAEDGTNVQVWPAQGFGNQEWAFEPQPDGTVTITSAGLGKALDVDGAGSGSIWNGKNVLLWHATGGANQRWVVQLDGTAKLNGVMTPVVTIRTAAGSGTQFFLASCGAKGTFERNAFVWDGTGAHDGLRWFLVPTARVSTRMPGASDVRGMAADGTVASRLALETTSTSVTPTWAGPSGTLWSVRYRLRWRTSSMARGERTEWGTWTSAADNSWANAGLNDPTRPNVDTKDGERVSMARPVPVKRGTGVDLVEVLFEVRSVSGDGKLHGAPVSGTVTLADVPKIRIGTLAWSPEGLRVPLSSGLPRGGNHWRCEAWRGSELLGKTEMTGAAASVTPSLDVFPAPAEGDQVTIWAICTSCDGMTRAAKATLPVTLDAKGGGITISPKASEESGQIVKVDPNGAPNPRCWVMADGQEAVEVTRSPDGRFHAPVPLGVPYTIFLTARDGSKWDSWSMQYPALPGAFFWNFDGWWCTARVRIGDRPEVSVSSDRTSSVTRVAGGGFERVHMGRAVGQQWTAKVSMVDAADGEGWEQRLQRMEREQGFCWFRDPRGHLIRAAITQVQRDSAVAGGVDVTVSMRRVDVPRS